MRLRIPLVAEQEASATGAQHMRDAITSSSAGDELCGGDLDRLKLAHEAVRHTKQQ